MERLLEGLQAAYARPASLIAFNQLTVTAVSLAGETEADPQTTFSQQGTRCDLSQSERRGATAAMDWSVSIATARCILLCGVVALCSCH